MDSFEWNKIFMGLGFSALAILGINELTKALYDVEAPKTAGYVVEGVEVADAGAPAGTGEPAALPDFGTVLATADIAAGEQVAAKCATCHTWTKGGANKVGPNLYGVVGNHHAHLGDAFGYSDAMKAKSGETWDYAALYNFIESPQKAIKGTKMAFGGIKKSQDRINLIAFLRTMADSPFPLPAPAPAGAEPAAAPAEGAPAEGAATPEAAPAEGTPAPAAPEAAPAEGTPEAVTPPAETPATPETPPAEPAPEPAREPMPAAPPPPPAPAPAIIEPNPDPQSRPASPEGQPPTPPATPPGGH